MAYCKQFGLEISSVSDKLFETAAALHNALSAGVQLGAASTGGEFIYIDVMGDAELSNTCSSECGK